MAAGKQPDNTTVNGHDTGAPAPSTTWLDLLQRTARGNPMANITNVGLVLEHDPDTASAIALDEHSGRITKLRKLPWGNRTEHAVGAWTDTDNALCARWVQHKYFIQASVPIVFAAVTTVAGLHRYHPIRDYLEALRWDGVPRVGNWLATYIGAPSTPYTQAVGQCWLLAAAARIFQPGCKADCMLILEGRQGTFKSTALAVLAVRREWFTDRLSDLGGREAPLELSGKWIIEMGELHALDKSDIKAIKAFLSRDTDSYRAPYDRITSEHPRQCIFAGSCNPETYNRDETGARRLWPVQCGHVAIEALKRDRDQLWAETVYLYREGKPWYLSGEIEIAAQSEQDDRYQDGPWDAKIARWLLNPIQNKTVSEEWDDSDSESVTIDDILLHSIGKPKDRWNPLDHQIVGKALRALKWKPAPRSRRSGFQRRWIPRE